MSALLTYAHDKNKNLVYIEDAGYGCKCECFCPHCEAPLVAKNGGSIREHHFAHSHDHECEGAYETMLHLLAKEIISECGVIMLPDCEDDKFPSGLVKLHDVVIERWDEENGFRPDLEGIMPNGERLLVEVLVSHKVDKKKHDTIIKKGFKCIEIDLNWQDGTRESLKEFLTGTSNFRKWIEPYEEHETGDGFSFHYWRNPLHEKAIEYLKKLFDEDDLTICPSTQNYKLKEYGYDICETHANYRGYKSDLLLFRSKSDDEHKGHISISIRGRRRSKGQKIPPKLRILDIIIREQRDLDKLVNGNHVRTCFIGDWQGELNDDGFSEFTHSKLYL